jgi:hypothetical protein
MEDRSLASLSQWSRRDLCSRIESPGIAWHVPDMVDWAARDSSTEDQMRIEAVLADSFREGSRLLHIGVGNSALARRFISKARGIDGLTIAPAELEHAHAIGLPGYRVFLVSKYAPEVLRHVESDYDIIVDNNLASFACCTFHFARMLDSYRACLAPGGRLLTDKLGMYWVAGDERWRMTFEDLEAAGKRFKLRAIRLTDSVYALERDVTPIDDH